MSAQNSIVRLDDSGGDSWGRVDGELELGLLAVIGGKALKQEGAETGSSSATERVEDQEALEGGAVVLNQISHIHSQRSHILPRRDGSYPKYHPRSPCQLYSDREHSY